MNVHSNEWIMSRVQEHYDEAIEMYGQNRVVGVFYQGSGNYGLDYAGSDVDTKCVILPTLDELANGDAPVSVTHIRENDEHIDFKDIRIMLQVFAKHNANFLEILYTDYCIVNPVYKCEWEEIIDMRDEISDGNPVDTVRSLYGIASEKFHALEHPYPSRMDWISRFGYDPKQLHHLVRLQQVLGRYKNNLKFGECLEAFNADYLVEVKIGKYNLEEARDVAKKAMDSISRMRQDFIDSITDDKMLRFKDLSKGTEHTLDTIKAKLIKKGILLSIMNGVV